MKFILGLIFGAVMSFAYVRYNVELPEILQLPGLAQKAAVAIAVDDDLYDLDLPDGQRQRALEVFFEAQPKLAASIDREAGSPFLIALQRRAATRRARVLKMQWTAYDVALEKDALRAALERKHGTTEVIELKRKMLWDAFGQEAFLASWLGRNGGAPTPETLLDRLTEAGKAWTAPIAETDEAHGH